MVVITDLIRERCAWVAGQASHVRLVPDQLPGYAAELAGALGPETGATSFDTELLPDADARTDAAAFWLTLDAVNFGSGWFPTLRKRPGMSGYRTIASGLRAHFERNGPWSAAGLQTLDAARLASIFGQDADHPLMALFASSLRDLGSRLEREYGGSYGALVDSAGSARELLRTLAGWDCFSDASLYNGLEIPFLKRAQIAAADLQRAGAARFDDLGELTMFADNLVPHVLRLDGVLWFEPALVARIDRGELIEHGSDEEVEIRACALHAVELLVAALRDSGLPAVTAATIDEYLWNRGQSPDYKSRPRHRSRCTAY